MERNDRWLSTALRVAPLLLFVWMVRSELVVIALGGLFALLLDPLKRRLARRSPRLGRQAPLLLTVGSIVLVVIPFVVIAARVVVSAQSFLGGGLNDIVGRAANVRDRALRRARRALQSAGREPQERRDEPRAARRGIGRRPRERRRLFAPGTDRRSLPLRALALLFPPRRRRAPALVDAPLALPASTTPTSSSPRSARRCTARSSASSRPRWCRAGSR